MKETQNRNVKFNALLCIPERLFDDGDDAALAY